MISHPSRYSDLRKYLYQPPSSFTFSGLVKKDRLPVPGLEGDEEPEAPTSASSIPQPPS